VPGFRPPLEPADSSHQNCRVRLHDEVNARCNPRRFLQCASCTPAGFGNKCNHRKHCFLRWKQLTPRTARHQLRQLSVESPKDCALVLELLSRVMTWANNTNKTCNSLSPQVRKKAITGLNLLANVLRTLDFHLRLLETHRGQQ
jgi:hypothetical protein